MITTQLRSTPRRSALDRQVAMQLARTEYGRVLDLFRALSPTDWSAPTDCPGWDARALAAHMLGMVEMFASMREGGRQRKAAERRGGVFIDALTAVQVDERRHMTPAQIVDRFARRAPKAATGRRRAPGFVRRRTMPQPQHLNGRDELWTLGYLIDIICTRDPWLHRIDLAGATGAELVLTAEHDAVIVADVVAEWAQRHGRPYTLHLTGPAGGIWSSGAGPALDLDAVQFCRAISGRGDPADGLLTTQVPF